MSLSRRWIGPIVGVLVVLLLGAGVYLRINGSEGDGESGDGSEPAGDPPSVSATSAFSTSVAIPVEGAAVVEDTLVISVTAAAQAAAWRRTAILAQVNGRVDRLPVRENQRVSGGSLLLALDTTDLHLELERARLELAAAEADFRERTLFDDQIDDPDVAAERERAARAKSGVDRAAVAVRQAEINLERARVRAPFTGRVADIDVVEGQMVRQGDELMTVVQVDPIRVEVQVLESEVGYLREGGSAAVRFAAFPDEILSGRIATINPLVDRQSRTARVTVLVPNPRGRVLPGMYARVSLEARRFPDRILVPKSAILERNNRTLVFVYEPDGQAGLAKWRYVTTGLENDSLVEIVEHPDTDMLEPGETVLTDGHYSLIHDAHVRLVENVRGVEGGRPE